MQIFEVIELKEYPYMETREVVQGKIVSDILNETSVERVFLLVDHDTKRIWTYNGPHSSLKVQVYGTILAGKLRQQLKLFYRIFSLNMYINEDDEFKEILEKPIGAGRAKPIDKRAFSKSTTDKYIINASISNPKAKDAIEYINQFPHPEELVRRFMIIGGTIYTDEEITESFVKEEKTIIKPSKLGQLNNGFTFFDDHYYSTRLIIKERKIQGIELYINKDDKSPPLELEIPIIHEDKFSKPGSIDTLISAFQIPEHVSEKKDNKGQDDSINQS